MKKSLFLIALSLSLACRHAGGLDGKLNSAEKLAGEAEAQLSEAEKQMDALEPDNAKTSLDKAAKILADPQMGFDPDTGIIRARLTQDEARLPIVRNQRADRDLKIAVQEQESKLDAADGNLKKAVEALRPPPVTPALVADARNALSGDAEALTHGRELEAKDPGYAHVAHEAEKKLEAAKKDVLLAEKRAACIAGPGAAQAEAAKLASDARTQKDADKKITTYTDALAKLAICTKDNRDIIASLPAVAKAPIQIGTAKPTTPQALAKLCTTQTRDLTKRLSAARKEKSAKAKGKKKRA